MKKITPLMASQVFEATSLQPGKGSLYHEVNGIKYACPIGALAYKEIGQFPYTLEDGIKTLHIDYDYGAGFSCGWDGSNQDYLYCDLMNRERYNQGYEDGKACADIIEPVLPKGVWV